MNSLTQGVRGSFTAPRSRALGGESGMTRAAPLVFFPARRTRPAATPAPERAGLAFLPPTPDTLPAFLAFLFALILAALWSGWVANHLPSEPRLISCVLMEEDCARDGTETRERSKRVRAPPRALTSL